MYIDLLTPVSFLITWNPKGYLKRVRS